MRSQQILLQTSRGDPKPLPAGDLASLAGDEILLWCARDEAPGAGECATLRARADDLDVLQLPGAWALKACVVQTLGIPEAAGLESFLERGSRFGFRIERRAPDALASRPERADFGINLFGFLSGNLGLGVAARQYLRGFLDAGLRVQPVEVFVGGGRALHDLRYADRWLTLDKKTPYAVNLFVLNPGDLAELLPRNYPALCFEERINVCVPFWELSRLPPSWVQLLRDFDVVGAASGFIQQALLGALDPSRVRYLPLPLALDLGHPAERRAWGLPEGPVIFLSSFEMASDINRKNPYAAIEAFERAFGRHDEVLLLIKVNNSSMSANFTTHMEALRAVGRRNPRVIIIDDVLDYGDVLSLYACADVFVSLHRAEGLGLALLEAMTLGKPVVATGWSGNMDFMSEQNSCLVGYDFVPVRASTQAAYRTDHLGGEELCWAEPRVEQAAAWMRRLAEDPALRARIGKQAGADMAQRQRRAQAGDLLAAIRSAAQRRGLRLI